MMMITTRTTPYYPKALVNILSKLNFGQHFSAH